MYVTREIRLRGDVAELGRADDGIGEAELHAIHEVEGFKAELEADGVVDGEVFDRGEVVFKGQGGTQCGGGAGYVTELECLTEPEGGGVEVGLGCAKSAKTPVCRTSAERIDAGDVVGRLPEKASPPVSVRLSLD